ncbi:MAG: hypothetical protein QXY50_02875 [Candidatus Caldarchaeum sp.]
MGLFDRQSTWLENRQGIITRLAGSPGLEPQEYETIFLGGVRYASQTGYVVPGWRLEQYLRAAVHGSRDIHTGVRIGPGFECVVVWGKPGTGKSNFARQLMYNSVYFDWNKVVDCTVTSVEEFLDVVEERKKGADVPAVVLDDISRTFSRQLWQENRPLYSAFYKSMQVIRSLFPVIIVTVPSLNYLPEMLAPMVSFDVHVTPSHRYFVNRIVPSVNFYRVESYVTKILVESGVFRLTAEPRHAYERYKLKREALALDAVAELARAMERTKVQKKAEEQELSRRVEKLEKKSSEEKQPGIALTCQKCQFVWVYKPRNALIKPEILCPRCKTKNKVPDPFTKAMKLKAAAGEK